MSAPTRAVTLPFVDGFESGDFSAWNGGRTDGFSVSSGSAYYSNRAACGTSLPGKGTDYYLDANFGDHPRVRASPVRGGLYVRFAHKFGPDFEPGNTARYHKILLINFEDANDLRREQIILNVLGTAVSRASRGQYVVENIHWNADRSFNGSRLFVQNLGTPVSYQPGRWDIIKIYIRPNTVGQADGTVRVWINGNMIIEHTAIHLRNTAYNPNLVIIGYYAPDTDIRGSRCWDDITISESDPDQGQRITHDIQTPIR